VVQQAVKHEQAPRLERHSHDAVGRDIRVADLMIAATSETNFAFSSPPG